MSIYKNFESFRDELKINESLNEAKKEVNVEEDDKLITTSLKKAIKENNTVYLNFHLKKKVKIKFDGSDTSYSIPQIVKLLKGEGKEEALKTFKAESKKKFTIER